MAGPSNPKPLNKTNLLPSQSFPDYYYDDDFQDPVPSQLCLPKPTSKMASRKPLRPYNNATATPLTSKKPKQHSTHGGGKENSVFSVGKCTQDLDSSRPMKKPKQQPLSAEQEEECVAPVTEIHKKPESDFEDLDLCHGLDSIESTIDCYSGAQKTIDEDELKRGYLVNSIEARLLNSNGGFEERKEEELEQCSELDLLLKLCGQEDEVGGDSLTADLHCQEECSGLNDESGLICCPLCGADISDLSGEMRQVHTNECLDKEDTPTDVVTSNNDVSFQCPGQVLNDSPCRSPKKIAHVSPVVEWLQNLGLAKYEEIFVREEIDWDTLKSLTEEDLFSIGVTALGPRKKIINSILELRKETVEEKVARQDVTKIIPVDAGTKQSKLITDYFISPVLEGKKVCATDRAQMEAGRACPSASSKRIQKKNPAKSAKSKDIPVWCSIPGTPFRVDAFKYLRRDCSHWFLSHFHLDHYQGLTKSFCHGKIYCSSITAKLVNLKIGIPWDMIQVLPINQKINIAGIDVTCFDANHCPGSLIILFEPPNGCLAHGRFPILRRNDKEFNLADLSCPQSHPRYYIL